MKHWDLAAGIGTAFCAVVRAGFSYSGQGYYATCEVNPVATGVFRSNLDRLQETYPEQTPHYQNFENFANYLPSDLFALARQARQVLARLPDSELPNYVTASVPCTESSKAGLAGGGGTEKGKLYLCVVAVIWAIQLEYDERGLSEPGVSSVGWMYETSPTDDPRPAIAELREQLKVLMGGPTVDPPPDEARCGGTSRRKTELYTNLGDAESWPKLGERLSTAPYVPMTEILRRGERLQTWDRRFHGTAEWPNVEGEPPKVYQKIVRSLGSHAWRAEPIRRKIDGAWEARYPIGVSLLTDSSGRETLVVPMPEQLERSLGFAPGYTAYSMQDEIGSVELGSDERRGLLGDVFGMHVHAAALRDRTHLMAAQIRTATPAPPPPRVTALPPPPPLPPRMEPQSLPEYDRMSPDLEFDELLEEGFAQHEINKPPKPPAKLERRPPVAKTVPDPWPVGSPEETKARRALAKVKTWLAARRAETPVPEAHLNPGDLAAYIKSQLMLDDADFVPSNIHRYRKVWREYLEDTLGTDVVRNDKKVRYVMRLLEKGLEADWSPPDRPADQKHPEHNDRRDRVKRMMAKLMSPEEAEKMLCQPTPPRVHFPNLKSCYETCTWEDGSTSSNTDFMDETIASNLKRGMIAEWPWPDGEPPQCILPLGVAVRWLERKQRGILDGGFINLWQKYIPFKYETMRDIVNMAYPNGWATVSDYKSGYSHIATPELSTYLGICWNGVVYYHTCCPFGVAVACRVFTVLNEVMFRPLRLEGIRLSLYIDDRLSVSRSRLMANLETLIQYAVMGMCGWFVNILKSLLFPVQRVTFTGLEIDFQKGRLTVPEKKLRFILKQVKRAMDLLPDIDLKELQSIAGRVGAVRMAVRVAPLLCWSLHKEAPAWIRALAIEPAAAADCLRQTLGFIAAHLEECNGSDFWERSTGLVLAGDAGDMGSGGIVVWPKGLGVPPMQTSYTEAEMRGIEDHSLHSTLREVRNVHSAVQWVCESDSLRTLARTGQILYLTDNQATCDAVMALRTKSKDVMDATWEVWAAMRQHGFQLSVRWCSRDNPRLKEADGHTRQADEGAIGLKDKYFVRLLEELAVPRSRIQLDPFSQREFAKAQRWFSKFSAPGSSGVDGFILPWENADGTKAFCFVNGPYSLMGEILRKITWERTDCILITPGWSKYWTSMLSALPISRTVRLAPDRIETTDGHIRRESMFIRGSRAQEGPDTSYWFIHAHLIEFSREERRAAAVSEGRVRPMMKRKRNQA